MAQRNLDQSELARRVGCSSAAIQQIVSGKTQNSRFLPVIASKLHVSLPFLLGETDDPSDFNPTPRSETDHDEVEIDSIDLAYGMGGTFLDTESVEVEKARFSRSWLRQYTDAPPEMLFSTSGVGDSMWPTIHDRDGVIADRSSRTVDQGDKIWAIVFGGVAMIKRLRPLPDGTVRIMSDNPQVSDEVASDGDLFIVGRVAAIVRRV
jgi:phage repressor protein C with HTH and peptisase S24 domain